MKKLFCLILAVAASIACIFSGCTFGSGETVVNLNVNNNYTSMTDEQWQEYLDKLETGAASTEKLQAAINRSLLCSVSIMSGFTITVPAYVESRGVFSSIGNKSFEGVYCGAGTIVEVNDETGDAYVITNCHVIYSDISTTVISPDIRLYLYGQDAMGVNYNLQSQYVTYGSLFNQSYVYYEVDGEYQNMINTVITDDENYRIEAEVVGASISNDIALLKVSGSDIIKKCKPRAAEFDDSDDVYAGEQVYAVGNPEGCGMSATVGVISKESENIFLNLSDKNPNAGTNYRVIRTDAAINGGNSGGGFFNTQGKLVGVINSKASASEIDNIGYALPGSVVKRLWVLMKENQVKTDSGNIGVTRAVFPADYDVISTSAYLNLQGKTEIHEIIKISHAGGGLEVNDVVRKIKIEHGGETLEKAVTRSYHIDDFMLAARAGDTVTVTVERNNAETEVVINFGTKKIQ